MLIDVSVNLHVPAKLRHRTPRSKLDSCLHDWRKWMAAHPAAELARLISGHRRDHHHGNVREHHQRAAGGAQRDQSLQPFRSEAPSGTTAAAAER